MKAKQIYSVNGKPVTKATFAKALLNAKVRARTDEDFGYSLGEYGDSNQQFHFLTF